MTKKEIENINVAVMIVDNGTDISSSSFFECQLGLTHPSNDFPPIDDENISVHRGHFLCHRIINSLNTLRMSHEIIQPNFIVFFALHCQGEVH